MRFDMPAFKESSWLASPVVQNQTTAFQIGESAINAIETIGNKVQVNSSVDESERGVWYFSRGSRRVNIYRVS